MSSLLKKFNDKVTSKYKLHEPYPYKGFDELYKAELAIPNAKEYILLKRSEISEVESAKNYSDFINKFIELYRQKIQNVIYDGYSGNTVICVHIPQELDKKFREFKEASELMGLGLRALVKVIGVEKHVKTQIITQKALEPSDLADVLWNMSLAIYVKQEVCPGSLKKFLQHQHS